MTYNNAVAREAIYVCTLAGFDQLQAIARLIAEIAECKNIGTAGINITNSLKQLFMEEIKDEK